MKNLKLKLTGIRPLIMHNGLMADPTNPIVKRIKEITSKGTKKITDADYEEIARLKWEGGLYWDNELGPVIPADNIERCIQLGAQKSRLGKDVQASVFCTEAVYKLEYKGSRVKEDLIANPLFTLRVGTKIQQSRIITVRPMFPSGWTLKVELEYDETILNGKNILKAVEDAGSRIGLGDWRPKFGRFLVEEI